MRNITMEEPTVKDDPLTRIQREIIEVTERENEYKKIHPMYVRKLSESDIVVNNNNDDDHNSNQNGHTNGTNHPPIQRAISTPYLTNGSSPAKTNGHAVSNGFNRRFTPNTAQKGIMQRFIASKGKLNMSAISPTQNVTPRNMFSALSPPIITPPVVAKTADGKPIRKGFVPVEEKIQKELQDIKNRETELKLLRKRNSTSYQLDFSSMDLSDKDDPDSEHESDDDVPLPGKLRVAKSIGELYEAMGDTRTPSPYQGSTGSGPDSYGSMKPAKSLAELCDLGPDDVAQAPSSMKLIAKWESLIQKKQETV